MGSPCRWVTVACLAAGLSACSEPQKKNAAPIAISSGAHISVSAGGGGTGGGTGTLTTGAGTGTSTSTATGTTTASATGGGSTGTGTGGSPIAFSGQLLPGTGGWMLPMDCSMEFYGPMGVDQTTGQIMQDPLVFFRVHVTQWPAPYVITYADTKQAVMPGDLGFMGTECDANGDGLLNDGVRGWYPGSPPGTYLTEIKVPAANIDIAIASQ